MAGSRNKDFIFLPRKPFLYTVDQVAVMLGLEPSIFADKYIFREGYDLGARHPRQLRARNIEPEYQIDVAWRINEDELKRWLRAVGLGWKQLD